VLAAFARIAWACVRLESSMLGNVAMESEGAGELVQCLVCLDGKIEGTPVYEQSVEHMFPPDEAPDGRSTHHDAPMVA